MRGVGMLKGIFPQAERNRGIKWAVPSAIHYARANCHLRPIGGQMKYNKDIEEYVRKGNLEAAMKWAIISIAYRLDDVDCTLCRIEREMRRRDE